MTPQEMLETLSAHTLGTSAQAAALLDEQGGVLTALESFTWPPEEGLELAVEEACESGCGFLWIPTASGPVPTVLERWLGERGQRYLLAKQCCAPSSSLVDNATALGYLGMFLSGASGAATWAHNLRTGRLLWGETAHQSLGVEGTARTADEMLRQVHEDDRPGVLAAHQRALESAQPVKASYRAVHPMTGAVHHVCARWFVLRNSQGQPLWLLGAGEDITEQVQASIEALGDAARVALADTFSAVGFWQWDGKSRAVAFDEHARQLLGLPAEDGLVPWSDFEQIIHPQDLCRVRHVAKGLCNGTQRGTLDCRIVEPRGGGVRRMHSSFQRVALDSPENTKVVGALFDIGEVLDSRQAVMRHTQRLELAVSGLHIGIFERDLVSGALAWNAQMFSILGAASIPGTERAVLAQCISAAAWGEIETRAHNHSGDEPFVSDVSCTNVQGRNLRLSVRVQVQRRAGGKVVGYYGTALDVTEQAHHEQERQAREQAEQASLIKSEILSRLSHELRTPLNAILGFSKLLEMRKTHPDPEELEQYTRNIQQAGMHLLGLVNDVLELTRLEDEALQPHMQALDARELLERVRIRHQPQAQGRGIELTCLAAPLSAIGDEARTLRILDALVSNAIGYNRQNGQVKVHAQAQGERAVFEVRDTGLGITAAKMARLFQPLERLDQEGTAQPGSGLGLYLSKRLAEKMGGSLQISSAPGQGTTARLELPLGSTARQEQSLVPALRLRPEKLTGAVLYIEDSFMNALVMQGIFKLSPLVELTVVKTLEEACAAAAERPPDVVLVDLLLPDSCGYEVKDALQAQGVQGPFIAVTANALPETRQRALSEGFFDFWTKPLDPQHVLEAFSTLLPFAQSETSPRSE